MKTIAKILGGLLVAILALFLFFAERDRPVEELIPLYANKDSKFMPIMGMKVHYRDEGVATDTLPLILLHGMSSSLNTWDNVALYLKRYKRVISLDLPGFALTGPSPENNYDFPYYSKFIDSFATRLKIKRFILVGNSMGGAITWNYALHNPSRLAKMVLIDAAGYPKKGESGSLGFKLASTPVINNLLLYVTPKSLVRKSLESIYADQSKVTDEQVERFHDVAIREGNRAVALQIFKGSFHGDYKRIKEIKTPTFVMWGAKDQLISVDNSAEFMKDIKGSTGVIFNVGHVPMEEIPFDVALSIYKFVR